MIAGVFMILMLTWIASRLGVDPAILLVPALLGWLLVAAKRRISTSRIVGARVQTHRFGPGRPMHTIKHELGHANAIKAQGGRVTHFVVNRDGSGYVKGVLPRSSSVVESAAVRVAGGLAEGSFAWASLDMELLKRDLAKLPSQERAEAERQAYARARSLLRWNPVDGEARRIYRQGWEQR